jgi:hypothetical protein
MLGWWRGKISCTLNGAEIDFNDLSESSRDHIIEKMREGYVEGQIVEEGLEEGGEV